ncbi:Cell division protein FtsN [Marinobacter nitratireducens]|uniref:Cell division protein FtsN n=1 Tax=Marinobacter nitratireducens TaxID=1137280 RepID=A0A072MWW4_9GAMM|nr:SPOR domain-containing protein [Marinobacter nitratireducens]KEF29751.1 Cell division protein FtsN [Marinobacter nitratireducens]
MSRDYARKDRQAKPSATPRKKQSKPVRSPKPRSKPASPAHRQQGGLSLKWILSLAAVGGFIGFIVYLNGLPTNNSQKADRQTTQPEVQETPAPEATAQQDGKKQNFRFYEMLPESEVIPPDVEEYTPGPAKQSYNYLVQSGSFRSKEDAERQRAQIAFQGLRASVQRIDLDSGSIWYRVNVGPFTSRSQMNSAIDKLVSINIQPLIRKIPKEG